MLRLDEQCDFVATGTMMALEADPPTDIATLIDEHYGFVFGFLYRLCGSRTDAEDLTQQTFLAACANLRQLREPGNARAWLCTIGRNAFLKLVSRRRTASVDLDAVPELADSTNPDTDIDGEQLQLLLNQMPEEYRTAVVLFYYEGCSYREIAERLGTPLGTVMSRLARGKAWLRRRLGTTPEHSAAAEKN